MSRREELNKMYAPLDLKLRELLAELKKSSDLKCTWGFYNNHSYKNEAGE